MTHGLHDLKRPTAAHDLRDNRKKDNGRRRHNDPPRNGKGTQQVWQRKHAEFTAKARTAAANGNDVDAENFYQHAEHYLRMIQGSAAL